ncbi:MAG: glycosyl hydrolase 2 galactose-binding domain-containing protein [Lachnospirales bacterium]
MIDLCGKWELRFNDTSLEITVPNVIEKFVDKKDEKYNYSYFRCFSVDKKINKKYILNCEGISYGYDIFINGNNITSSEGIWEHFKIDVTSFLKEENNIEIKITRPSFEKESPYFFRSLLLGFIPDVLFPFSGIFRPVYIEEKANINIVDCRAFANYDDKRFEITCNHNSKEDCNIEIEVISPRGDTLTNNYNVSSCNQKEEEVLLFKFEDVLPWSTYSPNLYEIEVRLLKNDEIQDSVKFKRGFRKIEIDNEKILLNGNRIYYRAILHWGYYPEEMSFSISHKKIYEEVMTIKNQGFNAVKFCLFIPDPYYFEVCNELGILVWQELPLWLPYDNGYLNNRIEKQYPNMIKKFIDNPSLLLVSIGCELDSTVSIERINKIYDEIKSYKSLAIICDNSGSGECYDGNINTKTDIYDYHFYPEINNMQNLINAFNHESREKKPWLFGEYNDMDSFRNLNCVIEKLGFKPFWASSDFSENLLRYVHAGFGSDNPIYFFEETVNEYGYGNLLKELEALGLKKAYDVRKYNLETTRSNDSISGYSITAIRDVPITSCGIIDDLGNPKFSNEDMKKINGDVTISMLPKLGRTWYRGSDIYESKDIFNFLSGDYINNRIVISSHLPNDLENFLVIKLYDEDEKEVYTSETKCVIENCKSKYYIDLSIKTLESTSINRYKLVAKIGEYTNDWDIWVYPRKYNTPKFYLYDNGNLFEDIENILECEYVNDYKSLSNCTLVTTHFNEDIEKLREKNVKILYVQTGYGYLSYDKVPFWRENVKKIFKNKYLDELKHRGYDGLNFISLTTSIAFDSVMVKELYPKYTSLVKRIDNRNFKTYERAFLLEDDKEKMIITSFDFSAGKGNQSRNFAGNYLGIAMLDKLIKIIND